MRVKLKADDLVRLSDEALQIRLAGVHDAGDWPAVRLIGAEQERRRYRAEKELHAEPRED